MCAWDTILANKGMGHPEVSVSGAYGKDFTQKEKQGSSLLGVVLSAYAAYHVTSCNHKRPELTLRKDGTEAASRLLAP